MMNIEAYMYSDNSEISKSFNETQWRINLYWNEFKFDELYEKQCWLNCPPQKWINLYSVDTAKSMLRSTVRQFMAHEDPNTSSIIQLALFVYKYSNIYNITAYKRGLITLKDIPNYIIDKVGECVDYSFSRNIS